MKTMFLSPLLGVAVLATFSTHAATQENPKEPLTGNAKLGFLYSKSDETSTSLNSGFDVTYKPSEFAHEFRANTFYTHSTDDDDGVNRYGVGYKLSFDLSDKTAVFLDNEYRHTQYQTYRQTYISTLGLERHLVDTKLSQLTVGGGPGYRYTQRQMDDDDYPNQKVSEAIANAFIKGKTHLTANLTVGGDASVDYGDSNTSYNLGANVTNKLVDNIALVLDTRYIYNTDVASDDSHDEVYSSVNLTYAF